MNEKSAEVTNPSLPKRRFRFRFSLRMLFVVFTLFAIGVRYACHVSEEAKRQREAIAVLKELNFVIDYQDNEHLDKPIYFAFRGGFRDYCQLTGRNWGMNNERRDVVPRWLCDAVGEDYFRTAVVVASPKGSPEDIHFQAIW